MMDLHPLSLRIRLAFEQPAPMDEAKGILAGFFDEMAGIIAQNQACVIGHIKGLAMLGQEDYLKVNLIAAGRPASTEASCADQVQDLSMVVNFMVYGLEPEQLFDIAETVIGQPDKPWSGIVRLAQARPLAVHHHHDHEHDHDHHEHHHDHDHDHGSGHS
jgi:hypothetical protein